MVFQDKYMTEVTISIVARFTIFPTFSTPERNRASPPRTVGTTSRIYPRPKQQCVSNQSTFDLFTVLCHRLSPVKPSLFWGMDKSTVNRIVKRVTVAICHLRAEYIKLPNTPEEKLQIQLEFFLLAGFPKVIMALDGTHIKIISPGGEDAEVFRNRKNYFSLNVQAAVSASYKILDLVARWPGATHDVTIFNNSTLKARFERNDFENCFILGDSGYAITKYLMTPLLEVRTQAEAAYNEAQIRSRVVV